MCKRSWTNERTDSRNIGQVIGTNSKEEDSGTRTKGGTRTKETTAATTDETAETDTTSTRRTHQPLTRTGKGIGDDNRRHCHHPTKQLRSNGKDI